MPRVEAEDRTTVNSAAAFARARKVLPGGVNSPVRAFGAVGGTPVFIKEGEGCRVTDVDGNRYVDYVMSYGPLLAGHAPERVLAAISKAAGRGTTFGMPTELETTLATRVIDALPSMEMVRFVNSGTEAAMSALRLARAATNRTTVIKCAGGYHGHVDALLVEAGSGALTHGVPSSPGVPEAIVRGTVSVRYNDLAAARAAFEENRGNVAVFAVEPVAGNMGTVPPEPGYLEGLRALCDEHGALLLFDEVMTGFRVAWGGAQVRYNVRPDLTCLGKVIGGGLPVGAYGGPRELMEQVSPVGPVYQAGTLSGNPLAMAAGLATLELAREDGTYAKLERAGAQLEEGLRDEARRAGVPVTLNRVASMLTVFFSEQIVRNYDDARACRTDRFAAFFHGMLEEGVILPPSQYEAFFLSTCHDDDALEETVRAARRAFERAADV